jgi:GT2 family glycosyltransferase
VAAALGRAAADLALVGVAARAGAARVTPEVSVVVPSHARPARLARLLDALAAQTLPRERFEVIVVHDYEHDLTHPVLARQLRVAPAQRGPARQRNLGWRDARAPLVAFTDDDCRPEPGWLDALLTVARDHPGAIVQGATSPDPEERDALANPYARTITVDPPGRFAQTCNILYPRAVLEAVDGFDERLPAPAGEDTDLALRARALGTPYVGAPDARVFHAVEAYSLAGAVRLAFKWRHLAYVVRRHPEVRGWFALRVFWREAHLRLCLALAGALLARRHPLAAALCLPYLRERLGVHGRGVPARLRAARELPGRAAVDLAEIAAMVAGSARYRTFVL